jgi:hypothetical protein
VLDVGKTCDPAATETGCPIDTLCDTTTKKCIAAFNAGFACDPTQTTAQCNDGFYCDGISKKCTAMVAFGKACTPPPAAGGQDPCHDGACDSASKLCTLICK